jgi:hypothetical protein
MTTRIIVIGFMIVAVMLLTLAISRKPWSIGEKLGATVVGMFFIPYLISAFWDEGLFLWIAIGGLVALMIFVVVDELILKPREPKRR